ncbi:MAG TPA: glycoside hydrolase family 15 protein [Puia sp.]|nr:glycoside hydrolase family 15 protein [Puia sp.]
MDKAKKAAPGGPGQFSAWTSGAKTGIGRALNAGSEVSFTLGKGILNEVYFPREDTACIRGCGIVVIDDTGLLWDERTDSRHLGGMVRPGVPMYELENVDMGGRYRIRKTILTDPERDTVLQEVRFEGQKNGREKFSLYIHLTPHLQNKGEENAAWVDDYKGMKMVFASGGGLVLAMACDPGWSEVTVGYIGSSDGLTDLRAHSRLTEHYDYAGPGNVQVCAAPAVGEEFVLAIGFGHTADDAAHQVRSSLLAGLPAVKERYIDEWVSWQKRLWGKARKKVIRGNYLRESAAALRIGESRRYPGGIIASLSIPWGEARGINDGMGYHLVWPRDLVESAWGFLALGAKKDALRILNYLFTTQDADGKWSQNMWLDGQPGLTGLQLDQVALPILLLDSCNRRKLLDGDRWRRYGPGLRQAVDFILRHGPMTEQDRWEQQAGLSPFTLATEVAALVAAGAMFEALSDVDYAALCRRVADEWNAQVETWTYVRGTETAKRYGVEGYYCRINPFLAPVQEVKDQQLAVRHHPDGAQVPIGEVVSGDALALVRFGLRRADDPRILHTIRVVDGELRFELPAGPCWRRFTHDGYGEDDDGQPFISTGRGGRGRCWPLLTGERAHYELAAGNLKQAKKLFRAMEGFSHQGFLPEQVWDAADLPEKGLIRGKYTGSAMPLTWAQAEYLKLAVSLRMKKVFDMPVHTRDRYL